MAQHGETSTALHLGQFLTSGNQRTAGDEPGTLLVQKVTPTIRDADLLPGQSKDGFAPVAAARVGFTADCLLERL